jgi:hypothetical protein
MKAMQPVGERWAEYTALAPVLTVTMLVPAELLADDGANWWAEMVGGNGEMGQYPVWLECTCGAHHEYQVEFEDGADAEGNEGELWQMPGLDVRMRGFMRDHRWCKWQERMAI